MWQEAVNAADISLNAEHLENVLLSTTPAMAFHNVPIRVTRMLSLVVRLVVSMFPLVSTLALDTCYK